VKVSVALGQYLRSGGVSFVEPYFLGERMALGLDLFFKDTLTNPYQSYGSESYGAARYSLINQSVSLDPTLMACMPPNASTACPSVVVKQAVLDAPNGCRPLDRPSLIRRSTIPRTRMKACVQSSARTWPLSPVPSIS